MTGADQPVAKAILFELAAHGAANVFACFSSAASPASSEAIIKEIAGIYPNTKIVSYPLNVADENETLALIDNILEDCGRLDVWVCSSAILGPASIEDTGTAQLQRVFEVNSVAPFLALKYARRAMEKTCGKKNYPNSAPKDSSYGSIIIVGSTASTYGGMFFI